MTHRTPTPSTSSDAARTSTAGDSPARPRQGAHRTAAAALLAGALVVGPALAASAHVRVSADDPAAGGYSVLTFRVPNESDTAGTTAVTVDLPTDTPLRSVSVEPVPGWSAEVVTGDLPEPVAVDGGELTEAPLQVTWTADPGVEIGPGEFQRFVVSAGPLPEAGTDVVLPATQTYSDGEVVAWDEPVVAGEEEPNAPAPSFTTVAAADDEGATTDAEVTTTAASTGAAVADATDSSARWLAGGGLVVAVAAFLLALVGAAGRRRAAR
ncbi:YcnI family protein [uncultured Pseudokineococcus sp.]|uniref:YcnI family copper-binding membrane protein n=1 Tax=uncultured Pseudokineococcus sp. TaxID=1642928 RepID=UPI002605E29B|nr:YcnI family protein [uncultured Pseudokineococcus sp.]